VQGLHVILELGLTLMKKIIFTELPAAIIFHDFYLHGPAGNFLPSGLNDRDPVLDDRNSIRMSLLEDALSQTDGVVFLVLLLAKFSEEFGMVLDLLLGIIFVVRHLSGITQLHLSVRQPFQQHVHRLVKFLGLKKEFKQFKKDVLLGED
jgi:hypothetical protein